MKRLIATGLFAFALAGCASDPTWDTAQFPPQPTYQPTAQVTASADEARK